MAETAQLLTARELEAYLQQQIPLTRAIGVRVLAADAAGVRLAAPFAPNVNHRRTVFGGSLAALAVLAGWAVVRTGLAARRIEACIVVQRHRIEYLEPATGDFEAHCARPEERRWGRFLGSLERRGRARIELAAAMRCGGRDVARFVGEYVADRQRE